MPAAFCEIANGCGKNKKCGVDVAADIGGAVVALQFSRTHIHPLPAGSVNYYGISETVFQGSSAHLSVPVQIRHRRGVFFFLPFWPGSGRA